MIDLHVHILPGLDDGARDVAESMRIARDCVADGIVAVAATPHVRDDYPNRPARILRATEEVREVLRSAGIALRVHTGAEIALEQLALLGEDDLRRLTVAGGPYVLIEFPYYGWPLQLADDLAALAGIGLRPILAHPERSADVAAAPEKLRPLVESGVLVQVTAIALTGGLGRATRATAQTLIRSELAHLIASDAHAPQLRRAGIASAASAVGNRPLARWLTTDVPTAIVAGADPPRRPRARPRRLFGR